MTSTDPQTIVYRIKQNAVWSDGVPVTADDFIYLWRNSNGSIKSNDIADPTGYEQIESVTGSDNDKTVTVVFRTPFGDWKGLFTGILPSHYVEQRQGNLKYPRVRRAIATGLNIQELVGRTVKPFDDKAEPLGNRIWVTGQPQYQDHFGQYGKDDVAGAQKLLREAGYTKGTDGYYAKAGKQLSLRYSTTSGNSLREAQAKIVQAQMREVGIEIRISNAKPETLIGDWLPKGNFDIAGFAWPGNPYAIWANHDLYTTDGLSNYGHYSNPQVDELFKQALGETDDGKRADLGNQIDRQVTADMATIPLYTKPTFIAFREGFLNIGDNPTIEGPFWNARTWGQQA